MPGSENVRQLCGVRHRNRPGSVARLPAKQLGVAADGRGVDGQGSLHAERFQVVRATYLGADA